MQESSYIACVATATARADEGLIAHWPLISDSRVGWQKRVRFDHTLNVQ